MWAYWMMFLLPAWMAFVHRQLPGIALAPQRWNAGWLAVLSLVTLLIGYRFQVGGDWFNYLRNLSSVEFLPFWEVLSLPDPGYQVISWLSLELGWGIFGLNLLGGLLFSFGLVVFCRHQPRPWLAMAVAVPYMVVVVAMGYSRQAIALGFAMLGLVSLGKGSALRFVVWVLLGATFHKTAVLLLPIAALAATRNRYLTAVWVGATVAMAYQLLLEDSVDSLIANYLEAEYESEGALIRLAMNALPAAILLVWRGRFGLSLGSARLWWWFAVSSLLLLALFPFAPSSTALDRMALYLIPLQVVVFSRFPEVFGHRNGRNTAQIVAVLTYYAVVLFVWLNYATHAEYWIPYRFYPFEAWF